MSSLPESLNTAVAEGWCHTKLEMKTFTYEWALYNFSFRMEPCGKYVESSLFPEDAVCGEPKWSLLVYPNGTDETSKQFLELGMVSHSESEVKAKFKFALLNVKREEMKSFETETMLFTKESNIKKVYRFVKIEYLEADLNLMPQNTLTILCKVSTVNGGCNISGQSNTVSFEIPEIKLSEDLGTMLDNEKFSDVKLVANGHELKAHKNILAARSKVFAAMFEHEMEERNMNRVSITDVDQEVLREMLQFMYTGKVPNLNTMAEDLLVAADKYDIQNLKLMCEEYLRKNTSIENAVRTLILSDRHNAKNLKSQTISFIIRNTTRVMKTQGWKDMRTTGSPLFADLFCARQLNSN